MAIGSRRKKRFTEQGVERLNYDPKVAPPNGRLEIADELCPGLILRVTPKGAKSFSVIYKVPGEGALRLTDDSSSENNIGSRSVPRRLWT
jgi:hypothetical protein